MRLARVPQKRETCSDRCRAALNRQRERERAIDRDRVLQVTLEQAAVLHQQLGQLLQAARGQLGSP